MLQNLPECRQEVRRGRAVGFIIIASSGGISARQRPGEHACQPTNHAGEDSGKSPKKPVFSVWMRLLPATGAIITLIIRITTCGGAGASAPSPWPKCGASGVEQCQFDTPDCPRNGGFCSSFSASPAPSRSVRHSARTAGALAQPEADRGREQTSLIWRYGHSENHRNQTRNRHRRNAEFHCCGLKTDSHQRRFANFRRAEHICRRQMGHAGLGCRSSGNSFRHRSRGTTRPHCRTYHRGPRDWGSSAQPDESFEPHFL